MKDIKLRKCLEEDLTTFVRDSVLKNDYYPNSLCFEDKSKIVLHNNWFSDKFHNIMIMIDMYQNTTDNGNKCKSPEEISLFGENNIFYF